MTAHPRGAFDPKAEPTMLHPIPRRQQTLKRSELTYDESGQLTRTTRLSLDDIYRRIDEDVSER